MSKAGERILTGLREAVEIAKGEKPASSITHNGHHYVPMDTLTRAMERSLAWRERAEKMEEALHQCLGSLKALGAEKGYASQAARKALGIEEDQS